MRRRIAWFPAHEVAGMEGDGAGPGCAIPKLTQWILLGTAVALTVAAPVRFLPSGAIRVLVGVLLAAMGTVLWLWALRALSRHDTSPDPARAPSALVDDGPYRFTRNPTYLGLVVVFLGVAVAFNSVWLLGFAVAAFFLARHQVGGEESYLESRFGAAFVDYRSRVRRWL